VVSLEPVRVRLPKAGIPRDDDTTGVAAYKVAAVVAGDSLGLGISLIIDAVCGTEPGKQMWRDLAAKHQAELTIIECTVSDRELHKQRIEERVRNIPGMIEVTWARVQHHRSRYEAWPEDHLVLDAVDSRECNLTKAITYLV
jgi:predicted kinase